MNSTEIDRPTTGAAEQSCSAEAKSACESTGSPCGSSGGCSTSKYRAVAFLVPFITVTAYSLMQGSACAAAGEHACTASAVGVGALAGFTSVGLVTLIKSLKHKIRAKSVA